MPERELRWEAATPRSRAVFERKRSWWEALLDYYDARVVPELDKIPWWIRWAIPAPEHSRDTLGWIDTATNLIPQKAAVKLASMPIVFGTVGIPRLMEKLKDMGRFIPFGKTGFYRVQDMPPLKVNVPVRDPVSGKVVGHETITVVSGHGDRGGVFGYPLRDINDPNEINNARNVVTGIGAAGGRNAWEIVGEIDVRNPVVAYSPNSHRDMLVSDMTRTLEPDAGRIQELAERSPHKVKRALGDKETLDPWMAVDEYREFLKYLQRLSDEGRLSDRALELYKKEIEAYLNYTDHWKALPPSERDRIVHLFNIAKNNPEVLTAKAQGYITPDTVFRSMLADRLIAEAAWRKGFDAVIPVSGETWEMMVRPSYIFRPSKIPAKKLTRGGWWMSTTLDLKQPLAVTPIRIYQAGPLGQLKPVKP